jgi:hypothetical protein
MNMPRQLFGENYRGEAIVIPNRVGLDDMGRAKCAVTVQ